MLNAYLVIFRPWWQAAWQQRARSLFAEIQSPFAQASHVMFLKRFN